MMPANKRIGTSRRPAKTPVTEPSSGRNSLTTGSWNPKACRSIAPSASIASRICRWRHGRGSAGAAPISSSTASEGLWGIYVVEVPSGGALNIEHHLYEKTVLVIAGRGSTEVWQGGQTKRQTFEWQTGSLFSIPLNAFHRFVNATNSPALLLCGTSAPNMFNLLNSAEIHLRLPVRFRRPLCRRRRFLQAAGRYRARPRARPRHAAHQFDGRYRQLRAAARQSPLARLSPRRTGIHRQRLLPVDRPARDRALFQGA